MGSFLARRLGQMLLTMLCLTLIVFYLVNLEPNLRKLAISQTEMHATDQELEGWLQRNGYRKPFLLRYASWLGVWPKAPNIDPATGVAQARFSWCDEPMTPRLSGRARRRSRLFDQIQGPGRPETRTGASRRRASSCSG